MCLICCDVRIRTAWPGGSGVHGWPGHHRRNRPQKPAGDRRQGETDLTGRSTGGAKEKSRWYWIRGYGTECVWSPSTYNRITEADHGPAITTVPVSAVRPFDIRTTVEGIETRAGWSQVNSESGRNGQRALTGVGRYDVRRSTIRTGSPSCEDAVTQCSVLSSLGSPDSPPATGRPRTEDSWLPGLLRVTMNSVERLHCSTLDGYMTQALLLSWRTVEDQVCIQPPKGRSLWPDFATRPGGRNNRAGKPTSCYTTPGSSFWGPRPSCHRRTENAGDCTNEPLVPSVPCWVSSYCCGSGLVSHSRTKCLTNGVVWRNEGLLYL